MEIDFINAAIVRHELKIGPGAKWLLIGKPLMEVIEGRLLPWKGGFRHGNPAVRHHDSVRLLEKWRTAAR
jgi:hypothetical protein